MKDVALSFLAGAFVGVAPWIFRLSWRIIRYSRRLIVQRRGVWTAEDQTAFEVSASADGREQP